MDIDPPSLSDLPFFSSVSYISHGPLAQALDFSWKSSISLVSIECGEKSYRFFRVTIYKTNKAFLASQMLSYSIISMCLYVQIYFVFIQSHIRLPE